MRDLSTFDLALTYISVLVVLIGGCGLILVGIVIQRKKHDQDMAALKLELDLIRGRLDALDPKE